MIECDSTSYVLLIALLALLVSRAMLYKKMLYLELQRIFGFLADSYLLLRARRYGAYLEPPSVTDMPLRVSNLQVKVTCITLAMQHDFRSPAEKVQSLRFAVIHECRDIVGDFFSKITQILCTLLRSCNPVSVLTGCVDSMHKSLLFFHFLRPEDLDDVIDLIYKFSHPSASCRPEPSLYGTDHKKTVSPWSSGLTRIALL